MKKKIVFVLVLTLALAAFAGCGGGSAPAPSGEENGGEALTPLVVGATPVPHAEVLEFVQGAMAELGYDLQIVQFTDYVQPNLATDSGELDANYFQHVPYMETFNANNGTNLVSVFPVHFEPLGLYKARSESLDDIGPGAIIAIPNDPTNCARALRLLEAAGLITLKADAGLLATALDIAENPRNIEIMEIESAQLPHILPDVNMAVINGNFAMQAGLRLDTDAVAVEDKDSLSAVTYANPIVVNAGNERHPGVLALVEVLKTDAVRDFINGKYDGGVVPVF